MKTMSSLLHHILHLSPMFIGKNLTVSQVQHFSTFTQVQCCCQFVVQVGALVAVEETNCLATQCLKLQPTAKQYGTRL